MLGEQNVGGIDKLCVYLDLKNRFNAISTTTSAAIVYSTSFAVIIRVWGIISRSSVYRPPYTYVIIT